MYIFRGRGVFIDVYKVDDKIATSDAPSLADINLRRMYRAIDSVATGRISSLFCDHKQYYQTHGCVHVHIIHTIQHAYYLLIFYI